ncbi:MAG: alpha/beta fold hydrolase [Candidatus Daviesbacteria bacterium]
MLQSWYFKLIFLFFLITCPVFFQAEAHADSIAQQTTSYSNILNSFQIIQELGSNLLGQADSFTFRIGASRTIQNQFDFTAQNTRIYDKDNSNSYFRGCVEPNEDPSNHLRGLSFNTDGVPAGYIDVTIDFSCRNYTFIPGHRYLILITNANMSYYGISFAGVTYGLQPDDFFTGGGLRFANGNKWDYDHNGGSCSPVKYIWNDQTINPVSGCNIWSSPRDDLYFILSTPSPTSTPTPTPTATPTPTPTPSKTPLIFIPGIGGSELQVKEDTIWSKDDGHGGNYNHAYLAGEKVWVNEPEVILPGEDDYFDVLRMKPDGLTSEANLELTGNLYSGAYQPTIDFFTSNGYTLNHNLFVFPYDWRKDISLTAPLLDQKIDQIKQQTGSQEVDIVAHSMGGLVARNYIADSGKAQKVRKLVTLGTPHLGAAKFLNALKSGICLYAEVGPFCFSLALSETKDVIQNMISGYQLAPSQEYFNFYPGTDNQHPYPYRTESGALSYNQIKSVLTTLGYNTSLFNPSEIFHSLDTTLSNTNGVDVIIVAGSGQPTLGQIIEEKTTSLLGIEGIHKDTQIINGDNTVPLFSASLTDGTNSLAGPAKIYYSNQKHSNLVFNGSALNLTKNILADDSNLPPGISTQPFNFYGTALSVHSPVLIHAYDQNGNHTGSLPNGDFEANIPSSYYETLGDAKFIWLPNNGQYHLEFEATDQGSFDFKIKSYENDINNKTILYKDVPLTISTEVETNFNTSSPNPPVLQVDEDGNGTADTQVNSTSILNGAANYDQTSPKTTIKLNGTQGNNNWFKSDVTVELLAEDEASGSGILKTEYSLDDGQTIQTYNDSFTISSEGTTKIKFRSIDNAGNEENPQETEIKIDKTPPQISISAEPKQLWPVNKKLIDVKLGGNISDNLSGVSSKTFSFLDEYQKINSVITDFNQIIKLEAWREGSDKDGRVYEIKVTGEDLAGNQAEVKTQVLVPHDQGKK